jgi:dTDP-4-amino-4,6-dideoxygalactose transaminase
MSIFNSLGSNYTASQVWANLFVSGSNKSIIALENQLGQHFKGQATLTYKGREALELALKMSGLKNGSLVGINGFTCYVVYRAVERAGYKPVFIDTAKNQMHFDLDELNKVNLQSKLQAIIVQNTLGYPVNMKAIKHFCDNNKILLIEDLAHSMGAIYEDGSEAGSVGAFCMFSFSQDKPLDVIAGGAVIDRTNSNQNSELSTVSFRKLIINRAYPFWTSIIRSTYSIQVGRVLHKVLKSFHLLANPMGDAGPGIHKMNSYVARIINSNIVNLDSVITHRKAIAKVYSDNLPKQVQTFNKIYGKPSYLRFPIYVEDRVSLIDYLRKFKIYIGDTWYDAPVAPKRYMSDTDYQNGECPNAEDLSKHIVNLPTHIKMNEEKAKFIAEKIGLWLK